MHKRSSRWSDEPVLDGDGKPIVAHIRYNDLPILKLHNRYRYIRSSYLQKFLNRYPTSLLKRLDLFQSQPNKFLNRPHQQTSQPNANYRHLIYELAHKGEQVLKDLGEWSPEPLFGDEILFQHSMMVNDTVQSLELQSKLVFFPAIAPDADRFVPVSIEHKFPTGTQKHHFDYYNDSNGVFAIDYGGTYRFFSLEAEHTNQVDCGNLRKTSFLKKYLAIKYIMDNRLYHKTWGIPNMLTLVVTKSQARIDTMKNLILRLTNGKGASYILFHTIPVMDDAFVKRFEPLPLFTTPWQRAGHGDFYLDQPTERR
jgi:hypothetical protein